MSVHIWLFLVSVWRRDLTTDSLLGRGNYHVNLSLGPGINPSNYKDTLTIPIKYFVSHRPPSRAGGSVGRAKKKKNEHDCILNLMFSLQNIIRW